MIKYGTLSKFLCASCGEETLVPFTEDSSGPSEMKKVAAENRSCNCDQELIDISK